jgi:hypothetical protein
MAFFFADVLFIGPILPFFGPLTTLGYLVIGKAKSFYLKAQENLHY